MSKALDVEVQVVAGIKEMTGSPLQSSPRLVGVVDAHVLDREKKRAAWRNLEPGEGNIPLSFLFQIPAFPPNFLI